MAGHLYLASVSIQDRRTEQALRHLQSAESFLGAVEDPRLQWWYHYAVGWLCGDVGQVRRSVDSYRSAIAVAQRHHEMELEWERAYGNLLLALRLDGAADEMATALLQFLGDKPSTRPGPYFYQIAADGLIWLEEYELARDLRLRAMNVVQPQGGRLARDHRELARAMTAMGDLDGAKAHLLPLLADIHLRTPEARAWSHDVAAQHCKATGDLEGALEHLKMVTELSPSIHGTAETRLTVAQMYFDIGNYDAAVELIGDAQVGDMWPENGFRLLALQGELAASAGDIPGALELLDQARDAAAGRQPRANVMAMLRTELVPWLALADPGADPWALDRRRAFRARWLSATARDIRRGMAPAVLALRSNTTKRAKVAAVQDSVDDLTLTSAFLSDTEGVADESLDNNFWSLHRIVDSLVERRGAMLVTDWEPGTDPGLVHQGLAGRLAFGLIAVVADRAEAGSVIDLHVNPEGFVIVAQRLTTSAAKRVVSDVGYFHAPWPRPGHRLPPRASFLATFDTALSLGWSIQAESPSPGEVTVAVTVAETGVERQPVETEAQGAAVDVDPVVRSFGFDDLESDLWLCVKTGVGGLAHARELVARAEKTGDDDILTFALLVASGLALGADELPTAARWLDRVGTMVSVPGAEQNLLPDPQLYFSRAFLIADARGDERGKWDLAQRGLASASLDDLAAGTSIAVYNWAQAELDRGALRSAWRVASLCDPMGDNSDGRALEYGIYSQVLLAEGQFESAVDVCQDRLALGRIANRFDWKDALSNLVRAHIGLERYDEALTVLDEMESSPRLAFDGQVDALRAQVLLRQGNLAKIADTCRAARIRTDPGFDAAILSLLVPVEAELQLAHGSAADAAATLDSFPIERHRRLDLPDRLAVERRVAAELGDSEREIAIARQQLALAAGRPRFEVGQFDIRDEFLATMQTSAKRDEEQIAHEQSKVASIVAHDVRNGLSAIALNLGLNEHGSGDGFSERSELALQPIRTLADQLDAVALWGVSVRPPTTGPVPVTALLESLRYPMGTVYGLEGGRLLLINSLPPDVAVHVDGTMLQIIVRNLIGNAIKHGRPGGIVAVSTGLGRPPDPGAMGKVVTIRVEDDGPGLKPEHQEWLHRTRQGSWSPGANLGLWIVRHYAGLLGLGLRTSTSVLGGARFDLVIPVSDGELVRQGARPDPSGLYGGGHVHRSGTTSSRVLVVEDDPMLSSLIVEALEMADKTVTTADTARGAIEAAAVEPPDFVLSDIELADGSTGFEVLIGLEGIGLDPAVALMSGQSAQQTRAESLAILGRELRFLQKPFSLEELYGIVG